MKYERLDGLVAATYTPFDDNGVVDAAVVDPMVEHLIGSGINGLYVCGSTGEGMTLSSDERRSVAEQYVRAEEGRVPVIIQVGHNRCPLYHQLIAAFDDGNLDEARRLQALSV